MQELDYKAIGSRIKEQREYLGYTRDQFADLLFKSVNFCRNLETGVKGMSMQTLSDVSEVLKISTDYILTGKRASEDERLSYAISTYEGEERVFLESLVRETIKAYNVKDKKIK